MPQSRATAAWRIVCLLCLALALAAVLPRAALASSPRVGPDQATLTVLEGRVTVISGQNGSARAVHSGETLGAGDRVVTAADSRAVLTFADGSEQELGPETEVLLETLGHTASGGTLVAVAQAVGVTVNRVAELGAGSSYRVATPSLVAMVRGTVFRVRVERDPSTRRVVLEEAAVEQGDVLVHVGARKVRVAAGERLRVAARRGQGENTPRVEQEQTAVRDDSAVGLLEGVEQTAEITVEAGSEAAESTGEAGGDGIRDTVEDTAEGLSEATEGVGETAEKTGERARDTGDAVDNVADSVEDTLDDALPDLP